MKTSRKKKVWWKKIDLKLFGSTNANYKGTWSLQESIPNFFVKKSSNFEKKLAPETSPWKRHKKLLTVPNWSKYLCRYIVWFYTDNWHRNIWGVPAGRRFLSNEHKILFFGCRPDQFLIRSWLFNSVHEFSSKNLAHCFWSRGTIMFIENKKTWRQ